MLERRSLVNKVKVPLLLMLITLLLSFLVPGILAQPDNSEKRDEPPVNSDLALGFDAYFAIVNYNEPHNPWVQVNYYYENGSYITMIYGIERSVLPSLSLNYQSGAVQVFDRKGKLTGLGFKTRTKSNLFVFVPA
ncbi:MAG: hypothetical protein JSW00_10030 [Thermoplasmata archaeon]|nr:MAG: hypothetical protein JSW00_10030 [Thermoplasmata archaeon]